MSKKVEEAKVETKVETTAEETTAVANAKEAGKNFGKKVWNFGKKALPVVAAFGVGVGACLVAGAISKKSSSADEDANEATADDSSWDKTLEEVSEE